MPSNKWSLRQRVIRVRRVEDKHYFVLFGKLLKAPSRFSSYLRFRDLKHQMQLQNNELKALEKKVAQKHEELQKTVEFNNSRFSDFQQEHLHQTIKDPRQHYMDFSASPEEVVSYGKPTISIILSIYNSAPYLEACMNSILEQSFKNVEIICVNDGSTDNSLALLEDYARKDPRIVLISQENAGGGAARNTGLKVARGIYLSFLDSDDEFDKTMQEKLFLEASATSAEISICGAHKYNDKTEKKVTSSLSLREDFIPPLRVFNRTSMQEGLFHALRTSAWNKLFRHDFILKNELYFQELQRANDLYFVSCALALAQRICLVKEPLVTYRFNRETSLQGTKHHTPLDFYHARRAIKEKLTAAGIYDQLKREAANAALSSCLHNIDKGKGTDAHRVIWEALRTEVFQALDVARFEDEQQAYEYYYPKYHVTYREMLLILDLTYEQYCAYKGI